MHHVGELSNFRIEYSGIFRVGNDQRRRARRQGSSQGFQVWIPVSVRIQRDNLVTQQACACSVGWMREDRCNHLVSNATGAGRFLISTQNSKVAEKGL